MPIRSWLFVPGDSERKMAKAPDCGADIVILDLEDAVAPGRKEEARALTRQWLCAREEPTKDAPDYWVRINPLDTGYWHYDVEAALIGKAAGLVVPKAAGPEHLKRLVGVLYELEPRNGIAPGSTKLLPLVSETAQAANAIAAYGLPGNELPRLTGLTWGAEDLSAAIGATRKHDERGRWTDLMRMVRAQTLLAAHAAEVAAIDTLHADFRDEDGLRAAATGAFADGFSGMLAIHPAQVPIINDAFSPSEEQLAEARAIVELFSANPGVGALQLDGRMVDQPHLVQAKKLLAQAR
ncbi:HpcH/HpaI aldolase/citrate lyase family protein [Aurantiacibacter aquimixticola]|uniref:CoA ester lyase n=1 Tax=Aurantiacibacter aquimixticola TaxID=1958945 RepID=A0A419RTR9_9SPHN|nr:CoA ester lyase [Aurantiacibacter aquimixticola]RJY09182.1 CoA ester lyase [Aurantiacibacter aquimixticola]